MKLLRRNLSLLEYIYIVWSLRFQLHEIYRKKKGTINIAASAEKILNVLKRISDSLLEPSP